MPGCGFVEPHESPGGIGVSFRTKAAPPTRVKAQRRRTPTPPCTIRQCADHCLHLHARVGYEQGPQVPDPRAPEYQRHLETHETWWRTVWEAQAKRGFRISTLTPEFGPPDYLHTLPSTRAPVSNLEEICDRQAQRQAENFARCSRK